MDRGKRSRSKWLEINGAGRARGDAPHWGPSHSSRHRACSVMEA
jgi:hypothetical protein